MSHGEHAPADRQDLDGLVIGIWRDVLSGPVGPDDDFFALGGDSIKAGQIVARLRKHARTGLSLAEFLAEVSTPRELAALVRARAV
ncbi:acyl carrier protein [Amycolatopsis thailandensis]|uniref:acyl carrier protein n=1 Tax=Amycolatopsis thailandensis TaxID=589330 RepID=UPI0036317B0C